jgi:hypothetical protein
MPTPVKLKQGANYYQPLCYFPIGYIYLSTSNVNPGQLFGGTWKPIKDRFLLLAGDTYKGGQTGGEATHKLTINEMPTHKHEATMSWAQNQSHNHCAGTYAKSFSEGANPSEGTYQSSDERIGNAGGNQPHNNMPPYIVVYGWVKVSN